ncbi:ribonuclease H-like domain-containing protein [Alkaliphilus transvaalensis]|uniref:ribonuclease H-like domain-containing protein n=1 Tax=Alkaliphilus transvaalensis TaxID=114628 RepID=UPI0006863302|nr:ribonuclease H-like domain-containing protein [Alkaliphilus transvaalensis]
MKIKNHTINEKFPMPSFYRGILEKNTFCILDIETTGLSSKYHNVILIGLLYPHNNRTVIKQFFAENIHEEEELLQFFAEEIKRYDFLITYNGVTFDYPFLKERFKKYNITWPHDDIKHFDILHFLKKCKGQLPLENLKLKTVENYLGINRQDTISGKDSVVLYKTYESNPSPALEKTILLHNYEDIYYLAKVATIFDHFPDVNSLLEKTFIIPEVPNKLMNLSYHPNDIIIKKNCLRVSGKTSKQSNLPPEVHYTTSYDFNWIPKDGIFQIEIPLKKRILPDKKKLYYLNLNEFEPCFNSTMLDDECSPFFYQHLMEIDLSTKAGLLAVISLINHIIDNLAMNTNEKLASNT